MITYYEHFTKINSLILKISDNFIYMINKSKIWNSDLANSLQKKLHLSIAKIHI